MYVYIYIYIHIYIYTYIHVYIYKCIYIYIYIHKWSGAYLKKCNMPVAHRNNACWGALTLLHSSSTICAAPAMFENQLPSEGASTPFRF